MSVAASLLAQRHARVRDDADALVAAAATDIAAGEEQAAFAGVVELHHEPAAQRPA